VGFPSSSTEQTIGHAKKVYVSPVGLLSLQRHGANAVNIAQIPAFTSLWCRCWINHFLRRAALRFASPQQNLRHYKLALASVRSAVIVTPVPEL